MKFLSSLISAASGSMGGSTWSHNRYGAYIRHRTVPTNPNTPAQAATRANFAALANRWQAVLTDAQREAWRTYSNNVPMVPAKGGAPVILTAASMYLRCNMPRLTAGLAIVDAGPTTYLLCQLTDPADVVLTGASPNSTVDFAVAITDEWATSAAGALLVFCSPQQAPTINFYKGPYRFAAAIPGALIPITAAQSIATLPPGTVDNKMFLRFVAVSPDGRISNTIRTGGPLTL